MKFKHPDDTKAFLLGICASITAVILWDIIKNRTKILDFKKDESS
jgi:hypothetical protein